jgi:medium-chain acyl-[acyl-carrier-protein] hydrolase
MIRRSSESQTPWIEFRDTPASVRVRLFCFHHAGGSALFFRDWTAGAPYGVDLCPIQIPGRSTRIDEPPYRDMRALARAACEGIAALFDRPYILFGHSMGAALAYEVALAAAQRGLRLASLLAASSRRPPHLPPAHPISHHPDARFLEELQRFDGIPAQLLEDRSMCELIVQTARPDFELNDSYLGRGETISCPVLAFGGDADPNVDLADLDGWRTVTRDRFAVRTFRGDHFYLNTARDEILRLLLDESNLGWTTCRNS